MPTAVVVAAFDAATDAAIEALRDEVAADGIRVRRAHRPHLTLSAARVDEADEVTARVREVAARHRPIALRIEGWDAFGSGVLWLRPSPSPALGELQRDAHASLASTWPAAFGEQSDPARWTAHCTVATRLRPEVLRRWRDRAFAPFDATVDALVVIAVGGRGDVARVPLQRA